MPADIVTRIANAFDAHEPVTVETKANLAFATEWEVTPGLEVKALSIRVNGIDEATLFYRAGHAVKQKGEAYASCDPLDLMDKFVRISIGSGEDIDRWYGVVVDDDVSANHVFIDAADDNKRKYRKRNQTLTVLGLEYFLDRRQIDGSVIYDTKRIGRPLVFNGGSTASIDARRAKRGNRHQTLNADNLFVFEANGPSAEWSAGDIIKYVLKYFPPVDDGGNEYPTSWDLNAGTDALLSPYKPEVNPQGVTIYQLLNSILNPQRGYCWWVEFLEDELFGAIIIHAESLAAAEVSLPSGGTLPQNSDKKSLDFDLDHTVVQASVRKNRRKRYNRCRARGAPMTATFTVGFGDNTLTIDWGAADATTYKNGAKPAVSGPELDAYNALSDEKKQERNDAARRQEWLSRVFACFKLPANWDNKSGDGGASSPPVARNWTFADVEKTGSILGGLPIAVNSLRLLHRTLLKQGVDYKNPTSPVNNNPAGSEPDLMAPFVAAKVATSPNKWQFLDKLNNSKHGEGDAVAEIKSSYSLYAQENCPGFRLRATGGVQHTLALNQFSGAEPTKTQPELDYTTIIATVACEADTFAEGVYPESTPAGELVEELLIEAGDDYRLDFLPHNTVVDIRNGDLVLSNASTAAGRLLRDDRAKLEDLARFAYEWYQSERASLMLVIGQNRRLFKLGTMITTVGDAETLETVNTVVGSIMYNFETGQQTVTTLGDAIDLPSLMT